VRGGFFTHERSEEHLTILAEIAGRPVQRFT
jgi:hypothetical protein